MTDVAAGLPQVDLVPLCTVTVTLSDAGAKVTRMSVHGWQDSAEAVPPTGTPGPIPFLAGEAA